jgi:hypothetical protein
MLLKEDYSIFTRSDNKQGEAMICPLIAFGI